MSRAPVILDFDRSVGALPGAMRIDLADWQEPIRFGCDDILPLLYECGFRWVRQLDFNELALEFLGDYQRDRMFRFQHIALAAVRTPVAGWP